MSATFLNWRSVTPTNSREFLVKGTELSRALCGAHSRFMLCEIRSYDADGNADRTYAIRDAATLSDADRREGKRPAIVAWETDLDKAIAYCQASDPMPDYDD